MVRYSRVNLLPHTVRVQTLVVYAKSVAAATTCFATKRMYLSAWNPHVLGAGVTCDRRLIHGYGRSPRPHPNLPFLFPLQLWQVSRAVPPPLLPSSITHGLSNYTARHAFLESCPLLLPSTSSARSERQRGRSARDLSNSEVEISGRSAGDQREISGRSARDTSNSHRKPH